ncbi:GNAT family N-acetyltransferase [Acinetobacter sp. SwsAc6]|uniref:GNAT family N-acetyltransferase n=1 Tax=Acinetobacter sp. SwsAc6 TaxID=2749439 RepID=UPI0015BEB4F0|nr:GNAT family N-acetyltransferase [Acinetobacter sp. SwsAc6]
MSTFNIQVLSSAGIQYSDWLQLWQGYQQFYQVQLTEELSLNTWQKLTDPKQEHIYGFVAYLDHEAVGLVHVIEHDSCWTIQPYAYLQDLFVLNEQRGQGIAKALIEQVHAYTKQRQCDRVYWLTHQDNDVAQKLYDQIARKTGFIQYRLN